MHRLITWTRRPDAWPPTRWMQGLAHWRARPLRTPACAGEDSQPPSGWGELDSTLELQRIEAQAERTVVQEIRLLERRVRHMARELRGEDQAYASALLLKLDRLAREQLADSAAPPPLPAADWAAPREAGRA